MNKENNKLGRGLSSLFSSNPNEEKDLVKNFMAINISSISVNPQQPRKRFAKNELEELAASIKSQGIFCLLYTSDAADE